MVELKKARGRSGEREPLERKDAVLFKGDWATLQELLAGTRVKPTEFIRVLVRRTIRRIQATRAGMERPVEDIDERLITELERTNREQSTQGSQPGQSRTDLV